MPQLVVLALVGAGLYAGYRWFARTSERIAAEVRRTEDELRRRAHVAAKEMGTLEYDPASGVYRPSNRG
ncbi:MAG: hypothetical protein ABW200_17050 [Hyphomicrobiaceae bacterium]|jgi:hypothetical protein